MTPKELREKTVDELARLLQEKQAVLRTLRLNVRMGQEKDVRAIRETRADIARLMTILKQKHSTATPENLSSSSS